MLFLAFALFDTYQRNLLQGFLLTYFILFPCTLFSFIPLNLLIYLGFLFILQALARTTSDDLSYVEAGILHLWL